MPAAYPPVRFLRPVARSPSAPAAARAVPGATPAVAPVFGCSVTGPGAVDVVAPGAVVAVDPTRVVLVVAPGGAVVAVLG